MSALLQSLSVICILLLSVFSATVQAVEVRPEAYDIYRGDVDGDGHHDYYFQGKKQFVLIHGEVSTPIFLPAPSSFVIYYEPAYTREQGTSALYPAYIQYPASYSAPKNLALNSTQRSKLTLSVSGVDYFQGDFDGDGTYDLLLRGPRSSQESFVLAGTQGSTLPAIAHVYRSDELQHDFSNRSVRLRVQDFNGDGQDDIVIDGATGYADTIYLSGTNGVPEIYQLDTSPQTVAPTLVGSSAGQFRVDESGAATYSMPLTLPAGTAGVAPSVSLNYSSQGGNGLLGQGWSLSGLSAVTRCRQTLGQDGIAKALSWGTEDRFCLDGQRLVLNSGSYGSVGATYKTEIDSFVTVTSVGGSSGKPASFKVARKDGSVSYYGVTADSKQMAGAHVLSWAQNEFKDSVGEYGNTDANSIKFSYIDDGHGHRIDTIRYAYGSGSTAAEVKFSYLGRADIITGFVAGESMRTTRRLSSVQVKNAGHELRHYNVSYDRYAMAENNKLSRIGAIQECVGSACLPATVFNWTGNDLSVDTTSSGSITLSHKSDRGVFDYKLGDFNGDGNQDLVWLEWDADGEDTDHHLMYAMSDGSMMKKASFYGGATSIEYREDLREVVKVEVIDYNVDGRQDIIVYNSRTGKWRVHLSVPVAGGWKLQEVPSITTALPSNVTFSDINSDGLVDGTTIGGRWLLERNSNPVSSKNAYSFVNKGGVTNPTLSPLSLPTTFDTSYSVSKVVGSGDFNGDGLVDFLRHDEISGCVSNVDCNYVGAGNTTITRIQAVVTNGATRKAFSAPILTREAPGIGAVHAKYLIADLNGDGLSDILSQNQYRLSNGQEFEAAVAWSGYKNSPQLLDYNGDGRTDVLWHDDTARKIKVSLWNGTTLAAPITIGTTNGNKKYSHTFLDLNGDSFLDRLQFSNDRLSSYLGRGLPADESRFSINSIENGLGNVTDVKYGSLGRSGHYVTANAQNTVTKTNTYTIFNDCPAKYANPALCGSNTVSHDYTALDVGGFYSRLNGDWSAFLPAGSQSLPKASPTLELNGPMMVVTRVASTAPSAGSSPGQVNRHAQSAISYYYSEAKVQAGGRGFLGFYKIKTVDEQTDVSTTTTYRQDFPLIGHPLNTEVRSKEGNLLSMATNTWRFHTLGSGSKTRYQPYIYKSEEVSKDLADNGQAQGDTLQAVSTTNTYDTYGNPNKIVVVTQGGGETFTKTTTNTYGSSTEYKTLGRLTHANVKTSVSGDSVVNGSSSRSSSFSYHTSGAVKHLLKSETVAAGTSLELTTTYQYDAFGNKTRATQTTDDGVRFSDSVFEDGRYLLSSSNALGHVTETILSRDPATGAPTKVQSLNGAVATITYDILGREISRSGNSGAWAETEYKLCGSCPSGAVFKVEKTVAGGGRSSEYFDALGRTIRTESVAFDGRRVYVDTEYDNIGRVVRKSNPYYSANGAVSWTENTYDILGRVIKATLPDGSWGKTDYNGYSTTVTNHAGHTKTEVKNAQGQLVRVIDNQSNGAASNAKAQTGYQYDADGNLRFMSSYPSDSGKVFTTELRYDTLGRKTYMNDPDKGVWEYRYNAFGELVWQMDAKRQVSDMQYDVLGRMINRSDTRADSTLEGYTRWYYDNNCDGVAQANATGQLTAVVQSTSSSNTACTKASGNYVKMHAYDGLGRPQLTQMSLPDSDDLFISEVVYDEFGRVLENRDVLHNKVSHPNSTSSASGTKNYYTAYGYLDRIEDLNSGQLIQKVTAMNARGQVTQLLRGNGATSYFGYDEETGRMLSQRADVAGGFDIQRINYRWDTLGNLSSRHNTSSKVGGGSNNLQESFCYDALNRLVRSAVGSITPACSGAAANDNTVSYDSLGNITYKEGVGNYTYGDNGSSAPVSNLSSHNGGISIGDVDGNGREQILLPPGSSATVSTAAMIDASWNQAVSFNDSSYDLYYGDLNGDGKSDIYFQGQQNFVLLHGDVATPILIDSPSFVVYQTASGYGAPQALEHSVSGLTAAANDDSYYGDFNGSGSDDIFVRGASSSDPALVLVRGSAVTSSTVLGSLRSSGEAGPHAVVATSDGVKYQYDANGNLTSDSIGYVNGKNVGGRTFEYSTFDKATRITRGEAVVEFSYGPSRSRYKRVDKDGGGVIVTTHYLGNVERISSTAKPGEVEWRRSLDGGALFTVTTDAGSASNDSMYAGELFHTVIGDIKEQYLYKDHLGSLDVITDGVGTVVQSMSFDPWGARREITDWSAAIDAYWASPDAQSVTGFAIDSITRRGYTGHEMVDSVGIIHMNGRIYDARIGRFLQADPFVQAPSNTQSLNRYSYIWNNPLNSTDPSGYLRGGVNQFERFIGKTYKFSMKTDGRWATHSFLSDKPEVAGVVQAALNFIPFFGQLASAVFAYDRGFYASGGDLRAGVSGAALSYLGSGVFSAIGAVPSSTLGYAARTLVHGFAGGVLSVLQGGKFGHGFISAGLTKAININALIPGSSTPLNIQRVALAAIVGGTISELTGGKFANGAITAAMAQAYNGNEQEASRVAQQGGFSTVPTLDGNFTDSPPSTFLEKLAGYFVDTLERASPGAGTVSAGIIGGSKLAVILVAKTGPVYATTTQATKAAKTLGFSKINETVHGGQAVYRRGKLYISRDLDGHNGGAWKMAKSVKSLGSRETRLGTFDASLNRIGN